MQNFSSKFILFFILFIAFLLISCREEINSPDKFARNVNEPLEANNFNSYTFLIDADKISIDYDKKPDFTSFNTRILITISDYSSGTIRINVKDSQSENRFSYFGNNNEDFYTELLNGFIPYSIELATTNFTGKLKIQLSRAY